MIVGGFAIVRYREKKKKKYPFKIRNGNDNIDAFVGLLNKHRNDNGRTWLLVDDYASMLAYDHVKYMMDGQKVSHDYLGLRRGELFIKGATNINEIVSGEFSTIETAFRGFKNSPSHNRAMLDDKVDTCGVSVRQDSGNKYYVNVIFFKR